MAAKWLAPGNDDVNDDDDDGDGDFCKYLDKYYSAFFSTS